MSGRRCWWCVLTRPPRAALEDAQQLLSPACVDIKLLLNAGALQPPSGRRFGTLRRKTWEMTMRERPFLHRHWPLRASFPATPALAQAQGQQGQQADSWQDG